MAAINLSAKLTDSLQMRRMDALLMALSSAEEPYVSKNKSIRVELPLETMNKVFNLDALAPAPYTKKMVSKAVDHTNFCYSYHFVNYTVSDWEYKPNRKCFVFRYKHTDAEDWFGVKGPYHLPFDRYRFPVTDRDFMTILVALALNRHEDEVDTWMEIDDHDDMLRFVATEGYIKQLRERLNWSGFKKSLLRWKNEKVALCTEGSFSGIWETPVIASVEETDDNEIIWITMSKRMIVSIIEYRKTWEQE